MPTVSQLLGPEPTTDDLLDAKPTVGQLLGPEDSSGPQLSEYHGKTTLTKIRESLSPLLGPTENQKLAESIPWGKDAQGSTVYRYRPAGGRLEQEGFAPALSHPMIPIPKAKANPDDNTVTAAAKAVYNTGAGFAEFFESPLGVATGGITAGGHALGGVTAKVIPRVIGGGFAAQLASQVPESARQAGTLSVTGTPQEKFESDLGLAGNVVLPGFLASPSTVNAVTKLIPKTAEAVKSIIKDQPVNAPRHPLLRGADAVEQAAKDVESAGKTPAENAAAALANARGSIDAIGEQLEAARNAPGLASGRPAEVVQATQIAAQLTLDDAKDAVNRAAEQVRAAPNSPEAASGIMESVQRLRHLAAQIAIFHGATEQPKESNASDQQQAAEVHGDVQPLPVQSEGQVPQPSDSGGIQPQAEGFLQEVTPQPSAGPSEAVAPVNPGGALKDLPQELQDKSNAVKSQMQAQFEQLKAQAAQKYQTRIGPGLVTIIKHLEPTDIEKAEGSVPVIIKHDNGGREEPVMMSDLRPVKPTDKTTPKAARVDLDDELRKRKLDPSVFSNKKQKQSAIERHDEMIGMGGALHGELDPSNQSATSIKNATVDQERAKRGLPPAMEPQRRSFGEVWDRAMAQIDQDPGTQDRLIDELDQKPRSVTDTEDALLLHRQVDLQNEYGKATRDLAQAYDDVRLDDVEREKLRVASWSDKLLQLHNITKSVGTETARGLNARKMMANEDFTLAQMETDLRAAKGGKPLTDDERGQISILQKRIEELNNKVNERETQQRETSAERASQSAAPEVVREAKAESETSTRSGGKKGQTPEEQRDAAIKSIKAKVEAKADPKQLSTLIQKLARAFVRMGVTERVPLVNRVHDVIKDIIPNMEWRDTMDAISGYGDFRPLSKDEISVKLRDLNGQMQQASKLLDMVEGEAPAKTGYERRTPTQIESDMIKQVNEGKKRFGIHTDNPNKLKSALATAKTRISNQIEDFERRLLEGDYSKKPRVPTPLDSVAEGLKAQRDRLKQEFDKRVLQERMKQRTPLEKTADTLVKWSRAFLLSSPATLAKLTGAAVLRLGITPLEETVGAGFSEAFPSLAERAPREGGFSVRAEAKALTEGFTKGMADSWQTLKTGKSDLDVLYGKRGSLPPEASDFLGHIHGALKAPVKRAEFARSFQKRAEHLIRNGVDVSDPLVQTRIGVEAYKDANRAIFLQDNRVVNAWKAGMARLGAPDKATGKTPVAAKIGTSAVQAAVPIVKVPTNIVAESMEYATGLVTGSARLGMAFRKGVENLTPDQADLIMRQLKKGSLGSAALLIGYFSPQVIGGFYQQGQKRSDADVTAGAIRIGGSDVPPSLTHAPLMEALQIGATVRRVQDSKLRKRDQDTQGIGEGIMAGALGLADDVPFVRDTAQLSQLMNPQERGAYEAELAKSRLVPQAVSWIAEHTDKDAHGNIIKRKPEGVVQGIQSGIPGLRKDLPERKRR